MSPLVAIGLAIILNVGVLVGGVVWLRRQMTRVAAERAGREPGADSLRADRERRATTENP